MNLKLLILLTSILFFTSGCVHKISNEGLVFEIKQNELNKSMEKRFPKNINLFVGKVTLKSPQFIIKDSLQGKFKVEISSVLFQNQEGLLIVTGKPFFNKKNNSIYLKNAKIVSYNFGVLNGKATVKPILNQINPILEKVFNEVPIYKVPDTYIKGKFMKKLEIVNSKLFITYGI